MCRDYRVPSSRPPGSYVRVCAKVSDGRYTGWKLWYVGDHAPVHGGHVSAVAVRSWRHGQIERSS